MGILRERQRDRLVAEIASMTSRTGLQRFWRNAYRLSLLGMGFMNADSELNGEDRFLSSWLEGRPSRQAPVIFDVGANEGLFTDNCRRAAPTADIYCFEPNPQTFARLESHFRYDALTHPFRLALGEETSREMLFDYLDSQGSGHASLTADVFKTIYHSQAQSVQVDVLTLDDFAARQGINYVDYVKIDTEGYELPVLRGARRLISAQAIGCVQFEWNGHQALRGDTLHEVAEILSTFDIYRILPNGLLPIRTRECPYDPRVEVFRYANYVALPY